MDFQKRLSYVTLITKSRFGKIVEYMDESSTKSRTFQIGYNKKTKKCVIYCWLEDARLSETIVLGKGYIKNNMQTMW